MRMKDIVMWPEGTVGHKEELAALEQLDAMGRALGYGNLADMAKRVANVRIWCEEKKVMAQKAEHFKNLGWPLPGRGGV